LRLSSTKPTPLLAKLIFDGIRLRRSCQEKAIIFDGAELDQINQNTEASKAGNGGNEFKPNAR
jgi:hypothetical protein